MSYADRQHTLQLYRGLDCVLTLWTSSPGAHRAEMGATKERLRRGDITKVVVTHHVEPYGSDTYYSAEEMP